jgi:hypothetical protein
MSASTPYRPRRVWLPLGVSFGLHALLFLGLSLVPSREPLAAEVFYPVGGFVMLDDEPTGGPARGNRSSDSVAEIGSTELSEPNFGRVQASPVVSPIPAELTGDARGSNGSGETPGTGSKGSEPGAGSGQGHGLGLFSGTKALHSVVYVIDRSLSMGYSGALAVARRELVDSLNDLPGDVRFQVILYNSAAEPLRIGGNSDLLPATEANRLAIVNRVQEILAEGGTDHVRALRAALLLKADAIYFVTDADELTRENVLAITRFNGGRSAIHAIELHSSAARPDAPLAQLAKLNRGSHRVVSIR